LNSQEFSDKAPAEVYATLLDRRQYLCSIRTMYRILGENGEVRERRDQLRHPAYKKPELLATGPNQVWSWDITKLLGPQKWTYFYLYVILDIFSRYAVGWMVAERESASLAERLIVETQEKEGIKPGELTVHMDRGAPMTAKSFALLLADLGITKSYSRPHVSDDNPFIESHFKTAKYMPDFPDKFGSVQDARAHFRRFFQWYAMEHHHSGIALLTPHQVHHGLAELVIGQRQEVLTQAYARHPERFVRRPPKALQVPTAVWINPPPSRKEENQASTNSVPQSDLPGSPRNDDLGSTRPVAPPGTTPPATPREAEREGCSSQETLSPLPVQPSPRQDNPARALPINTTAFKPTAERKRPRRSAAALH
jgi:putative transposase